MSETLGPPPRHEDEYPGHWPETRQRIQNVEEYHHHLTKTIGTGRGFSWLAAVENALKGWLSASDDRTFGDLWRDVANMELEQPGIAFI